MKLIERKKVAIALGYYARAVGEIKNLADAIAAYALDEYRNDVDCQIGFRKGYQEAEEHLAKNGQEAHELRELVGWIARLEQQVHEQRTDILEYLKRQEALSYFGGARANNAARASGGDRYYAEGGGSDPILAIEPDGRITEIGGGGAGKPIPYKVYGDEPVLDHDGPFQMRRVDNGELFCQDGKPVVHQGYKACAEACRYLKDNMGIQCLPAPERPLGQQEWNPPVFNISMPPERQSHKFERWYARLEEDLRKQKIEDPFHNQDS